MPITKKHIENVNFRANIFSNQQPRPNAILLNFPILLHNFRILSMPIKKITKKEKTTRIQTDIKKLTSSLVFRISVLPFHHVIVGAGREPTTSHHSWYGLSADNGRFSPCNFIHNGRTICIACVNWENFENYILLVLCLLNLCMFSGHACIHD